MEAPEVTVTFVTPDQNARLKAHECGVILSTPSDFTESGQAHLTFTVGKDRRIDPDKVDAAAYSFARFNRETDRERAYQIAIEKAQHAA